MLRRILLITASVAAVAAVQCAPARAQNCSVGSLPCVYSVKFICGDQPINPNLHLPSEPHRRRPRLPRRECIAAAGESCAAFGSKFSLSRAAERLHWNDLNADGSALRTSSCRRLGRVNGGHA